MTYRRSESVIPAFGHDLFLGTPLPPFPLQIMNVPTGRTGVCVVKYLGVEWADSVFQQQAGHRAAVREDNFFSHDAQAVIWDVLMRLILFDDLRQETLELFIGRV